MPQRRMFTTGEQNAPERRTNPFSLRSAQCPGARYRRKCARVYVWEPSRNRSRKLATQKSDKWRRCKLKPAMRRGGVLRSALGGESKPVSRRTSARISEVLVLRGESGL